MNPLVALCVCAPEACATCSVVTLHAFREGQTCRSMYHLVTYWLLH